MASLEVKLRSAAASFPDLQALLGSNPFRWFDTQLDQSTAFPAVVVLLVSSSTDYAFNRRMATGYSRVQFTIWGSSGESARAVEAALACFLDQFNAIGIPGLQQYPNIILNRMGAMFPDTQPGKYQRIVDASIFDNEKVS